MSVTGRWLQRLRQGVALEDGPVLVEQLRLVVQNQTTGTTSIFLLVIMLSWLLGGELDHWALGTWTVLMLAFLAVASHQARRNHRQGIAPERARAVVRRLVIGGVVHGLLWGGLGWVVLGAASQSHVLLVLAVIAGVSGGAIATLAPLVRLQAAMLVPLFALISARAWLQGGSTQAALGITFVIYPCALLIHGRNNARSVRKMIELQFENRHLMSQVRGESLAAQQARQQAENANAAKSKFLAAASHDLRQPIHAQGLFLEVLAHTDLNPHQQELLASARQARESSVDMLNNLLDFSRLEAGVIQPQTLVFRVQTLLNKIEREFVQQADAKGLTYRSRESALVLASDPALVELILRNLVSNAIKYTQHGGLLVTCREKAGRALLQVWDTGIGIEPSVQAEVFREFFQAGNVERDRDNGLGLGLAIAKGLAQVLGLDLHLRSVPRRGSVFTVGLPLATVSPPLNSPNLNMQAMERLGLCVLVVDDDDQVRTGMRHLLTTWGCTCEVASSMDQALTLAADTSFDLLICDHRLSGTSTGIDVVKAIRTERQFPLPALLITADTDPLRLQEAAASGLPVLHKPVTTETLRNAIVQARRACTMGEASG